MIDTRLSYVVAVARTGSFTAAAASVGLTQSAVTRSVAELERQLGYQLFHRSVKGAMPTEKGRDFIERAKRILDDTQDLMRGFGRPDDPYATTLQIGVCPSSMEWLLVTGLADLHRRFPTIRFDVSSASFERMIQQLLSGSVEVAIGFDAAFSDWAEVRRLPLGMVDSTYFVRKGHPLLSVPNPTRADLAKYEIVSPSLPRPYIATTRDIFESQGMDWKRHVHVIDSFAIARNLVETSNAIAPVSRSYARNPTFKKKFELIEPSDLYPSAVICAAVRVRSELTLAARRLISILQSTLSRGERALLTPVPLD